MIKKNSKPKTTLDKIIRGTLVTGFSLLLTTSFMPKKANAQEIMMKGYRTGFKISFEGRSINRIITLFSRDLGIREQCNKKSESKEKSIRCYLTQGTLDFLNKDLDKALENFLTALDLDPSEHKSHNNIGVIQYIKGDLSKALHRFENAISLDPLCEFALNNRAIIKKEQKDYEEALRNIESAIKLQDGRILRLNQALILKQMKRFDDAIKILNKMDESNKNDLDYGYYLKAEAYEGKGDFQHALMNYDKSIELSPKNANSRFSRGVLHYRIDNLEEALDDFSKARELAPKSSKPHYGIGLVLINKKEFHGAVMAFNEAIIKDKDDPSFYFHRGIAHYLNGDKIKARSDFLIAIELDSSYKKRLENLFSKKEKKHSF